METPQYLYLHSLTVDNLKCFRTKEEIQLFDGDQPAMFTVILAENGMGKTTLLRAIASVFPVENSPLIDTSPSYSTAAFNIDIINTFLVPIIQIETENIWIIGNFLVGG